MDNTKSADPERADRVRSWLKSRLRELGKTQTGLADALGRNPSQITRILSGAHDATLRQIEAIALYLETDARDVFARMAGVAGAAEARVIPVLHDYGGHTVALVHFRAAASSDTREAEISRAELDGEKALSMGLDLALLGRRLIERRRSADFAGG